jgi:hypothetical protein
LSVALDTLGDPEPLLDAPQPNGQQAVPEEDGFERRLEERHQADLHRRAEEEAQQQADAEEPGKALSLKDMLEDKSPEGHRRLGAYLREQSYVTEEMADQLMRKHGLRSSASCLAVIQPYRPRAYPTGA